MEVDYDEQIHCNKASATPRTSPPTSSSGINAVGHLHTYHRGGGENASSDNEDELMVDATGEDKNNNHIRSVKGGSPDSDHQPEAIERKR